jgi:hypothetical protein
VIYVITSGTYSDYTLHGVVNTETPIEQWYGFEPRHNFRSSVISFMVVAFRGITTKAKGLQIINTVTTTFHQWFNVVNGLFFCSTGKAGVIGKFTEFSPLFECITSRRIIFPKPPLPGITVSHFCDMRKFIVLVNFFFYIWTFYICSFVSPAFFFVWRVFFVPFTEIFKLALAKIRGASLYFQASDTLTLQAIMSAFIFPEQSVRFFLLTRMTILKQWGVHSTLAYANLAWVWQSGGASAVFPVAIGRLPYSIIPNSQGKI